MRGLFVGAGLRRRLLLSVLVAVGLVLVALIAGFNLLLRERLHEEASNALVARSSAELAAVRRSGDRLSVPEINDGAAVDGQAWVFAGRRVLERPRAPVANERAAISLDRAGRRRSLNVAATDAGPPPAGMPRRGSSSASVGRIQTIRSSTTRTLIPSCTRSLRPSARAASRYRVRRGRGSSFTFPRA